MISVIAIIPGDPFLGKRKNLPASRPEVPQQFPPDLAVRRELPLTLGVLGGRLRPLGGLLPVPEDVR